MPADALATAADARMTADAARTLAFRRSLRASRARRAAASTRRRRLWHGRGAALVATGALAVLTGGAVAQQQRASGGAPASSPTTVAVQRALGIVADGIVGPQTRGAVRRFQRRRGLVADGVIGPQTLRALGVSAAPATAPAGAGVAATLRRIALCESSGNPAAISADGRYRGKYQFSRATWAAMGGRGDPAQAPEVEQDRLAAKLLAQRGPGSWPNCA